MNYVNKVFNLFKKNKYVFVGVLVIIFVGIYFIFFKHAPKYQFITVQNGPITESVSITGNTTPNQSVSLSFGASGTISHTYSDLGKKVSAGQVLAELNTSDLFAQLHQAQAALLVTQTSYDKLVNGATGTDIEVLKATVSKAQVNLDKTKSTQETLVANAYNNLLSSTPEAVPDGAVNDYTAPVITGNYSKGVEGKINISLYYTGNGSSFSASGIVNGNGQINTTTPQPIGDSGLYIKLPSNTSMNVNNWVIEIPNKKAPNYLLNYNAYQSALSAQSQAVSLASADLEQAQANLTAKQSAARPEDVAMAKAQIQEAQANIESIRSKLSNAQITTPISGVITQFDAKIGQLATPSVPLVSIMSNGGYEIDAGVSETDVGKISVGNKVTMTLDAFANESFTGSVFYIAPAETNIGGVISYQVKILFDKADPRLKSGLTANIDIQTKHKDGVLILPQYAILQNDQGTFVETVENNKIKQNPVTLGVMDQKGNVEIVSGVTSGEQVLNIGLKVK